MEIYETLTENSRRWLRYAKGRPNSECHHEEGSRRVTWDSNVMSIYVGTAPRGKGGGDLIGSCCWACRWDTADKLWLVPSSSLEARPSHSTFLFASPPSVGSTRPVHSARPKIPSSRPLFIFFWFKIQSLESEHTQKRAAAAARHLNFKSRLVVAFLIPDDWIGWSERKRKL